ncbi:MAG: diaminopimelate decarboxylase [Gammaproteobacteria bacterium]
MTEEHPLFFSRSPSGELCAGGLSLAAIVEQVGTPCYIYHFDAIQALAQKWQLAFHNQPERLCYSVKANSNLAVLRLFADAGWSFDIVSGGELQRLQSIGVTGDRIRFSGVGKTASELRAAVDAGLKAIHLESFAEAKQLQAIAAAQNLKVAVSVRVNPDVRAGGHSAITTGRADDKFGVPLEEALALYQYLLSAPELEPIGLAFHIGSQIADAAAYASAIDKLSALVEQLRTAGIPLQELDIGGGMAAGDESAMLLPQQLVEQLQPAVERLKLHLVASPGRALVACAGVLVTQMLYLKQMGSRQIAVVDAAMNDYIRPALYDLQARIEPVFLAADNTQSVWVAGCVCESTDYFVQSAIDIAGGLDSDASVLLAILNTGAYGMSMSSNYNSRFRPPEVAVEQNAWRLIRRRENIGDLVAAERPFFLNDWGERSG